MKTLNREDLHSLEEYTAKRAAFRTEVMVHKKNRQLQIGPHVTLYFEDRLTMQYQIQEMLRVERIFESAGIDEELATYNPMIPDGSNWKVTFMIEVVNVEQRKKLLANMIGIEDRVWVQIEGFDRVWAIADEDLERNTEEKTSSVHFLRFELNSEMVVAIKSGVTLSAGIAHEHYDHEVSVVAKNIQTSLVNDLD